MGKVVGIDLGTTFSAIAVVNKHGKPEILANREGERITPSVVFFNGDTPIVGSMAKRLAVANPEKVVQFVKRQMGNSSWKFPTESGQIYTSEEASAIIIKRLKEDAEIMLGETVCDAVITVPAYFDDAQRKATQDAGRIAGLNVLRIINEPTAAALAYGIERMAQRQTVLVYDLGGGTFDVTIMRIGDGEIGVIATGGDRNLGGFDWENQIMNFLNEEFMKQGGGDLSENPTLEQDLRDKAEIAKKSLSSRDKTTVFLSAGGKNASITLTLAQFDELTSSLLNRTGNLMELVLEEAGLGWESIDKVLLVGGSTRMKAVPVLIERITGKRPSMELHPDEVVALGAALQGTLLQIEAGKSDLVELGSFPLVEIKDVCSHSLGVISHDEFERPRNTIILRRQTPYGTKVSETFSTLADWQTAIDVQVTEGEEEIVEHVEIIRREEVKIPPYPKGAPVEVFFQWNLDGILHITVFDLTAQAPLSEIHFKALSNLSEQQVREKTNKLARTTVG
jgi:molecular chaperone DnaK